MSTTTARQWGHAREVRGRVHRLSPDPAPGLDALRSGGAHRLRTTAPPTTPSGDPAPGDLFVYPWEHYPYWVDRLGVAIPAGSFGEQVTSIGLVETEVHVGDTFRWGDATVRVSRPGPGDSVPAGITATEMIGCSGFYLRVLSSGAVRPDDELRLLDVDPFALSVATVAQVLAGGPGVAEVTPERVLLARHLLPSAWVRRHDPLPESESVAG